MVMTKEFFSRSLDETREFARQFAVGLQPGDVVCLNGQLGAGKTEFMRGIAQVFNCDQQLSSPTFSIFNIYEGTLRGSRLSCTILIFTVSEARGSSMRSVLRSISTAHIFRWSSGLKNFRTCFPLTQKKFLLRSLEILTGASLSMLPECFRCLFF